MTVYCGSDTGLRYQQLWNKSHSEDFIEERLVDDSMTGYTLHYNARALQRQQLTSR
jgi:hypothetical protein